MVLRLSGIEKVEGFRCSDGKILANEKDALLHQANLDLVTGLGKLVNVNCYTGMNAGDVLNFLTENKVQLAKLFKDFSEMQNA